ncbi:hypothetical protein ACLMAJ_06890 [Nocardia sp. KC 131]|uniref:hypothetical protein n=1 Tax=Nocardia arseniciresistens TaxID=3392119 RepID=UPI00398E9C1C
MSWLRRPSKQTVKLVACFVVIGAIAWSAFAWLTRPNDAERYLNQIQMPGFTKVTQKADTDVVPWVEAIYAGPVSDIRQIVTGPDLTLGPPPVAKHPTIPPRPPIGILPIEDWIAYGDSPNNCHVAIYKVRDNQGTSWELTDAQISGMKDGSIDVFRIHVSCGDG